MNIVGETRSRAVVVVSKNKAAERRCTASILFMFREVYGFHDGEAYSKCDRMMALYAVSLMFW